MIKNKWMFGLCVLGTMSLSQTLLAEEGLSQLFDVKLGEYYRIKIQNDVVEDNIPKSSFKGIEKGVGQGLNYYFEPKQLSKHYASLKFDPSLNKALIQSSFKLYLLPFGGNQGGKADVDRWQVISIDWSDDRATEQEAYQWAISLCNEYSKEISVAKEITDFPQTQWYECHFESLDKILNIGGMGKRVHISLSLAPHIITQLERTAK